MAKAKTGKLVTNANKSASARQARLAKPGAVGNFKAGGQRAQARKAGGGGSSGS